MKNLRHFAFVVFAFLAFCSAALADPPSRAVRLKYMSGQVSIQPGGVEDWVAATINRPLTTSDNVWTDKDSRAELHLGTSAMRMDQETSLTLTNVSDNTVQVQLHQGTLNLRVQHLFDGEIYEVDTPNLAFTVLKSGNYRFDVDANGDATLVTVWKGEGEGTGQGPGVRVHSKEQARFFNGKTLAHGIGPAPNYDGFDDWCRVRDDREDRALSVRYVPRGVIGYEDLDGYGHWVYAPPYGWVWSPATVAVGWAPYRYGHWIWVEPWGWTWVDDAPWGFAPFHYGRWIFYRSQWSWCPGPVVVRPYYAPALVAWVGGSHFGVSVSFGIGGGLGWFPLGFGEPYIPHYRVSRSYFQSVNVTNTRITNITYVTNNYYNNSTNITRIKYVNQRVNGAVTVVPHDTFVNSRPVSRDAIRVPGGHFENAVIREPDVRPSRTSVLGAHAGERAAIPWHGSFSRPVVSKLPPPREPRREVFERGDNRPGPREERVGPPSGIRTAEDNRGRDDHRPDRNIGRPDAQPARVEADSRIPASVPRPPVRTRTVNADQPGSERAIRHDVPHPPDGSSAARESGSPSSGPAIHPADDSRRGRDRSAAANNVPRPPDRTVTQADVHTRTSTDNAPPRQVEDRPVPRPQGNVRHEAPPRDSHSDVQQARHDYPDAGRQVSRAPEVHRDSPPPQVHHESRAPQRDSTAAKSSSKSESHAERHSAPAANHD